ncbi:hypothetical protein FISHEDRAFT_57884 [Fistulina hepatica ATCC 64428]|uniref:Uncharacterized protein n=1 Tax=Fistulina hepatica ATCC 64428 TaxID=1128425 RepID=A0A0D7AHU1_9AGAR|nr:hypothetical protein FISHEDRAFT_57884 [Fistulina hepatica ATCC 64428]
MLLCIFSAELRLHRKTCLKLELLENKLEHNKERFDEWSYAREVLAHANSKFQQLHDAVKREERPLDISLFEEKPSHTTHARNRQHGGVEFTERRALSVKVDNTGSVDVDDGRNGDWREQVLGDSVDWVTAMTAVKFVKTSLEELMARCQEKKENNRRYEEKLEKGEVLKHHLKYTATLTMSGNEYTLTRAEHSDE